MFKTTKAYKKLKPLSTTITKEEIEKMTLQREPEGIIIGVWDEDEYKKLFGKDYYKDRK